MKFGSVCSGIEAASCAWDSLGWKASWLSEIEPFPSAVLKHHYPDVPNFGDMTKFKDWSNDANIDVFVGGTPCQSFSVAGLRKGLDDPRGNLMLTYLAIANKYRPKWLVWENVPGVLSSGGGEDFASLLRGLGELGYGFAYRVLDAQYFGVAQRRRRVFVVGCIGNWRSAAAVLFESHSLSRNTAPSRKTKKDVTGPITAGIGKGCRGTEGIESNWAIPVSYGIPGNWIGRKPENGGNAVEPMHDLSPCLTKTDRHGVAFGAFGGEISDTVTAKFSKGAELLQQGAQNGGNCVLQPIAFGGQMSVPQIDFNLSQTLQAKNPQAVATSMAVRRLTPVECERLQGFPDNYTNIPWRNKFESPDGPRYKALGNSMAVPVMKWIGQRIQMVEKIC